jgi:microcystin-dependent protein
MLTRRALLQAGAGALVGAVSVRGAVARAAALGEPDPEVGEIMLFAGDITFGGGYMISGWSPCDGREVPSDHPQLRDVVGTAYSADGVPRVPDLRGRTAIGAGAGPGQPHRPRGERGDALAAAGHREAGLGLAYLISPHSIADRNHYLGEVCAFAFNHAPEGWAKCDGQLLPLRTDGGALFSVLGTHYGGNGNPDFALPDLRGRSPLGHGEGSHLKPVALGQRVDNLDPSADRHPRRLHLNFCIVTRGEYPPRDRPAATHRATTAAAGATYLGELRAFSSEALPPRWLPCDGRLLPITSYAPLFSLLGTIYGGNPPSTFALPDLRGLATAGASAEHELGTVSAHPATTDQAEHTLPFNTITWGIAVQGWKYPLA